MLNLISISFYLKRFGVAVPYIPSEDPSTPMTSLGKSVMTTDQYSFN